MSDRTLLILLTVFLQITLIVIVSPLASGADNSNVSVATSRGATTNYDEIKVGDTSCRQAMISATQLEFGVGTVSSGNDKIEDITDANDAAVFARITYQLGMPKRIDCSYIYELEIMRLKEQIKELYGK